MWYKIDLTKFVVQLLPPILRSKFLVALLKVLVLPLSFVYDKLMGHRENVFDKLETSANVIYLEKVLNETFFQTDRYISLLWRKISQTIGISKVRTHQASSWTIHQALS